MSFIRIKKIKGYEYAYLVNNKWRKVKGPRQKVKGYLGKVYKFGRSEKEFKADINKEVNEIIKNLIIYELSCLGFEHDGQLLKNENIIYNKITNSIYILENKTRKKCVIANNEGFLCNFTLSKLFNLKPEIEKLNLEEDRLVGLKLAEFFVEAGLKVPENVFVEIYQKLFSS